MRQGLPWAGDFLPYLATIDLIHKSPNAFVPYPTMPHSEQKLCAHFCSEWSIVGHGKGTFWDLWNCSIQYKDVVLPVCILGIMPHMWVPIKDKTVWWPSYSFLKGKWHLLYWIGAQEDIVMIVGADMSHGNRVRETGLRAVIFDWISITVVSFTEEVSSRLDERPLVFNGRLANRGLTSLVKKATGVSLYFTVF